MSWARLSETAMMRQMFSWAPMSKRMEARMTNPKLAANCAVNTVVWVKKPGPVDEVAIKKAAPHSKLQLKCFFSNPFTPLQHHERSADPLQGSGFKNPGSTIQPITNKIWKYYLIKNETNLQINQPKNQPWVFSPKAFL